MKPFYIILLVLAAVAVTFIVVSENNFGGGILGQSIQLPHGYATGTVVGVTSSPRLVLSGVSGYTWIRLTNLGSTSTITCAFSSSSAGMVQNAGIIIQAPLASSTNSVWDSGESNVEAWVDPLWCMGAGDLSVYAK